MNVNIVLSGAVLLNAGVAIAGMLFLDFFARRRNFTHACKMLLNLVAVLVVAVTTGLTIMAYGNFGQPEFLNKSVVYILDGKVVLDQKYTVAILRNETGMVRPVLFANGAVKDCEEGGKYKVEYGDGLHDYFLYSAPK